MKFFIKFMPTFSFGSGPTPGMLEISREQAKQLFATATASWFEENVLVEVIDHLPYKEVENTEVGNHMRELLKQ